MAASLRFLLDEKYTEVENQLIKSIDNKFLAIKIDGATIFKRSIMGINVQFQLNGKIVVKTLAMKEYFVSSTSPTCLICLKIRSKIFRLV